MSSYAESGVTTNDKISLSSVQKQRKMLDKDSQLLANRIRLLQMEEERTRKKIQETIRKTQLIIANRKQQQERMRVKQNFHMSRLQNLDEMRAKGEELRNQRKSNRKDVAHSILTQKRQDYTQGKALKLYCLEQKQQFKQQVQQENIKKKNQIRAKSLKGAQRLQKWKDDKLKRFEDDYNRRVQQVDQEKEQLSQQIMEMELLEMELIKRLQNTQQMQKQAYQELESVLNQDTESNFRNSI